MPVVTAEQGITIHTARGVTLHDFMPEHYQDAKWTRDQRDASRCDLVLPPQEGLARLPEIVPWLHHVTVYDMEREVALWSGPIQKATENRAGLTLAVKDHAAYLYRTRDPITKDWDGADASWIGGELWRAMLEHHGVNSRVITRDDPEGDRFDYSVVSDEAMLDQTIGALVNLGLRWTVVSGTAILGPVSLEPTATLGADDFLGDGISLVRDGSAVYNDVLVRGADVHHRETVGFHGQSLQTIHNVDDMFGVSNVKRAAQQFVRHTGTIRTRLELAANTQLHPDAPVTIDQLMPSARFIIEDHGIRQLMELTGVEVIRRPGAATVAVSMESVEEDIELLKKRAGASDPTQTLGGQPL
ncbi:minor tail protein [Mycobacterium phage Knocker]|nr:minor tail protein [Mycobacterium phage Knocker]